MLYALALGAIIVLVTFIDRFQWVTEEIKSTIETDVFNASLKAHFEGDRCTGFNITIENKTTDEIEILWDKCFYIENNQTNEGFYFSASKDLARQIDKPRAKDLVFSKTISNFCIYPLALVEQRWARGYHDFDRDIYRHSFINNFATHSMLEGEHGIYLVVSDKKEEYKGKMSFKLTKKLKN